MTTTSVRRDFAACRLSVLLIRRIGASQVPRSGAYACRRPEGLAYDLQCRSALRHRGSLTLFLCAQLRRELRAEILGLEYLPDLDLGLRTWERIGRALHPVDGFLERIH